MKCGCLEENCKKEEHKDLIWVTLDLLGITLNSFSIMAKFNGKYAITETGEKIEFL
mgnify:FL=1